MMKKHDFQSPLLDKCINDRESFLKTLKLDKDEDRDDAKTKVIASINGAKYNDPILKELQNQILPFIRYIINSPKYAEDLEHVKKTYPEKNIEGKTISRILQYIENNLLECYINFLNDRGLLKWTDYEGVKGPQVALIFDGFQVLLSSNTTDQDIQECREHAFNVTGYDIPIKLKPFDNKLVLPNNYADCAEDLPSIKNKYNIGVKAFVEKHKELFDKCISSNGFHKSIAEVAYQIFKDRVVYDSCTEKWYHCTINNIWKEKKEALILEGLIQFMLSDYFEELGGLYLTIKCSDPALQAVYEEKSKKAWNVGQLLGSNSFSDSIVKSSKTLFMKENFYEDKLDSNTHLLAFSNKVFNMTSNKIRDIIPNDYIMTHTGYEYPENVEDEFVNFLDTYFKTLFP